MEDSAIDSFETSSISGCDFTWKATNQTTFWTPAESGASRRSALAPSRSACPVATAVVSRSRARPSGSPRDALALGRGLIG